MQGLVVADQKQCVANYHHATIESLSEMIDAMGSFHPQRLRRWHIMRRVSPTETKYDGEIFDYLERGAL